MHNKIFAVALLALCLFLSCTKETSPVSNAPTPSTTNGGFSPHSYARYSGPNYSQPISLDTANALIGSYLTSVNYPMADTALRSLTFDADTLRAYLQNSNIVTLKFMLAHTPTYKSEHNGIYAVMDPEGDYSSRRRPG